MGFFADSINFADALDLNSAIVRGMLLQILFKMDLVAI